MESSHAVSDPRTAVTSGDRGSSSITTSFQVVENLVVIALPKRHCEGLEDPDDEHDPNCQENDHRTAIPVSTLGEERHPPDPQHESCPRGGTADPYRTDEPPLERRRNEHRGDDRRIMRQAPQASPPPTPRVQHDRRIELRLERLRSRDTEVIEVAVSHLTCAGPPTGTRVGRAELTFEVH